MRMQKVEPEAWGGANSLRRGGCDSPSIFTDAKATDAWTGDG